MLYLKSGRRTFNNHDIAPLVIREFQSIENEEGNRKLKKEREKSVFVDAL